jgi:hypothetical protein
MATRRQKDEQWNTAKRLCRLNDEEVQIAKQLGMGPRSLLKNIPSPSQRWKQPVKAWVRKLHSEKFGKGSASRNTEKPQ